MWAVVDGRFVRRSEAAIRVEDRGLTFGDGLFEVLRTFGGRILFFAEHAARLRRSAAFLKIPFAPSDDELKAFALQLVRRNGVDDGEVYIELTRGVDPFRDHRYPPESVPSTLFLLAFPLRPIDPDLWATGAAVFTHPDLRHRLCEHKTLNLLPNVLAKNFAYARGGYEALLHREEPAGTVVTEGGSSNYFCVRDGLLVTPAIDNVLPGITRGEVLRLAAGLGIHAEERRVLLSEFLDADEVFLVSTVSRVMPVASIDGLSVPAPGPVTRRLMRAFEERIGEDLAGGE